jgi:hypothetical protein
MVFPEAEVEEEQAEPEEGGGLEALSVPELLEQGAGARSGAGGHRLSTASR